MYVVGRPVGTAGRGQSLVGEMTWDYDWLRTVLQSYRRR